MSPNANMGAATLAITQGVTAFNIFLPKFSDVRKAHPLDNPDIAADVRMGEIAACAVTVGTGAIVSNLTESSAPVVVSVAVCLLLVVLYESTLRANRPFEHLNVDSIPVELREA